MVFLKRRDPPMCTYGILGLSCETSATEILDDPAEGRSRRMARARSAGGRSAQHTHTNTHTHRCRFFFVLSSVFYFVPMSFFCTDFRFLFCPRVLVFFLSHLSFLCYPACLFFLSRLRFFVPTVVCLFCPATGWRAQNFALSRHHFHSFFLLLFFFF